MIDVPRETPTSNGYITYCPNHSNKDYLLYIYVSSDGQGFLHCQAGCNKESIMSAVVKHPRINGGYDER